MAWLTSSCAAVPVKDQEWCGDMGSLGAACFHTLTDEKRDIPKSAWDDIRFGQVCTTAANLADTKAVIEKLCSMTNACTFEVMQKVSAFYEQVDKIQSQAVQK